MRRVFITVFALLCGVYASAHNSIKSIVAVQNSQSETPLILNHFYSNDSTSHFEHISHGSHRSHSSHYSHYSHYSSIISDFRWMEDSLRSDLTNMAKQQITSLYHPDSVEVICNTINEIDSIGDINFENKETFILLRIVCKNNEDGTYKWNKDFYLPLDLKDKVYIHTYTPKVADSSKFSVIEPYPLFRQMVEYYHKKIR